MNNILSFNEYSGQELERVVYDNELNEKKMLRGFFNKLGAKRVRAELAEEIEMSKTIMEGIQSGLESLNENFDQVKKSLDKEDNSEKKGEKEKLLDSLIEILEQSRKNTWDLNQLIDEGEIDYAGFTANVGIASVAYFGILFTPFRAVVLIHKGYNYFFNIVKNTIRKALVMLQLNFDQFENLIITKGFQSDDYQREIETAQEIEGYFKDIETELVGKGGVVSSKKINEYTKKLQAAKARADEKRKSNKALQNSGNYYNCLDQYNNTYTRSLETLRQYTQEDVQKQLDSIKNSMNKLAGQEVDLQTYSELIIAAAEEHAYKVSSSIYNKFAKMTEVFSLPNQKKLIDLIQEATTEEMDAAKNKAKELNDVKFKENAEKAEEEGKEIFTSNAEIDNVQLGELKDGKYDKDEIRQAKSWTYDVFNNLSQEDQDKLEGWLLQHKEVLDECDDSLKLVIGAPMNDYIQEYANSLIDYIGPCLLDLDELEESVIMTFDEYVFESKKKKKKKHKPSSKFSPKSEETPKSEEVEETEYKLSDEEKEDLDKKIDAVKKTLTNLMVVALGEDYIEKDEFTDEDIAKLNYIIQKSKDEDIDDGTINSLEEYKKTIESKHKVFIDFKNIDNSQIDDLKELYEDQDLATIALSIIGKRILKDSTFVKNSRYIVGRIKRCFTKKRAGIPVMISILLVNSIKKLKEKRSQEYVDYEEQSKKSAE